MSQQRYETWPYLEPKAEDVDRFDRAIAAEKKTKRPNQKVIEAWERDRDLALSLAKSE
jgi:hypothetical protein